MQKPDTTVRPSPTQSRFVLAAGGGALAAWACGALVFATSNSDTMIKSGFEQAFAAMAPSADSQHSAPLQIAAKSEDEWLRVAAAPGVLKTAAVGEVIRLTGIGPDRSLTVVDVRDVGEAPTHIDTSATASRVLLVTCREGDEATGTEFRLRLEGGYLRDVAIAQRAHAL